MPRRQRYIFAEEPRRGHGFLIGLLVVVLLAAAGLIVWNFAMNHSVTYTKQYVTITKLPEALENFTILHLSDLNGASIGENQSAVRKAVESKSPSCIVLSGNMVGRAGDVQPVLDLVAVLPKNTPILLLPGEDDPALYATAAHASLSPYADWAQRLQEAGVTILDEPVCITRGKAKIWFVPEYLYSLNLEDTRLAYQNQINALNAVVGDLTADQAAQKRNAEYQVGRMERIREAVASISQSDIQVAVSHMPLTRDYVITAKLNTEEKHAFTMHHVSLVLAGGYCGGQWRLPGAGAIWAPEMGFFPDESQISGLSYLSGIWQYISPGLGVSDLYPVLPLRMFNSPDATLLVLSSSVH